MGVPNYSDVVKRLDESNIEYARVELQYGGCLLLTTLGGNILGPFLHDGTSVTWLNEAYLSRESFKKMLDEKTGWLQGGARTFIAPEIQYCVKDRNKFEESYFIPEDIYPGNYKISETAENRFAASQDMNLDLYNISSGKKELHFEKEAAQAKNPLRHLSKYEKLMDGVSFLGYEAAFTIKEHENDGVLSEIWDITELKSGGELYIPCSPAVEYTHYYKPVGEEFHKLHKSYAQLKITGDRAYKMGYKAAHLAGKAGYLSRLENGQDYLIIRNFFNNPSSEYAEEPYHTKGLKGHSVHVYNDDGSNGGFGELECNGQTIGGITGKSESTDIQTTWVFLGEINKLRLIALNLMGIDI